MLDNIEQLRKRVASSPENLEDRYALGRALIACQDYAGALIQLVHAQASPRVRRDAMRLIAEALDARGFADLAVRKRKELSEEIATEGGAG